MEYGLVEQEKELLKSAFWDVLEGNIIRNEFNDQNISIKISSNGVVIIREYAADDLDPTRIIRAVGPEKRKILTDKILSVSHMSTAPGAREYVKFLFKKFTNLWDYEM